MARQNFATAMLLAIAGREILPEAFSQLRIICRAGQVTQIYGGKAKSEVGTCLKETVGARALYNDGLCPDPPLRLC